MPSGQGGAAAPPARRAPGLLIRAAASEVVRLLARRRLSLLVATLVGYGLLGARTEVDAVARGAGVAPSGALAAAVGLQVMWLSALGLPLAIGGSLAEDRSGGLLALRRTRGLSARGAVASYVLAATVVAIGVATVACVSIALLAHAGAPARTASLGRAVAFAPRLLEQDVAPWLCLVALIYGLAGATLATSSVLAGMLGCGRRTAEIVPAVAVVALGLSAGGPITPLNPFERMSFLQVHGASWTRPLPMLAYWTCALVVLGSTAGLLARRDL